MPKEFRLYNTLTRQIEPLTPAQEAHLRFYGCGPTVYSYAHIGNFRSFLTADLILRTARAVGWKTTYITNITDVGHLTGDDTTDLSGEDRMARALRSKEGERFANVWDLARHYGNALLSDWETLNLIEPDVRPRATEHVREQIRAIEELLSRGSAYETSKGVYFSVASFEEYGKLSGNIAAEALEQAVRDVVVDEEKRDPRDFALWKKDPDHLMQWHSPWGWGFPGWHIECSVMAQTYLGEAIDLHTGGEDLIFPHHECEIAQAESLSGKPFATHWVHTRFLQVEGQKMSKRHGNFYTVRDLVTGRGVDPLALRLALISGQYRKPFNFTFATLKDCERHLERLRSALGVLERAAKAGTPGEDQLGPSLDEIHDSALEAMLDDLNTPLAVAHALDGTKLIRSHLDAISRASADSALRFLQRINDLLGIVSPNPGVNTHEPGPIISTAGETSSEVGHRVIGDPFAEKVERLIAARNAAREARNFAQADALRDELRVLNVEIRDTPEGTTWQHKSRI